MRGVTTSLAPSRPRLITGTCWYAGLARLGRSSTVAGCGQRGILRRPDVDGVAPLLCAEHHGKAQRETILIRVPGANPSDGYTREHPFPSDAFGEAPAGR